MDFIRTIIVLCSVATTAFSWNITNLEVCYNKVTVTKNLIEFKKCVSNEVTDAELTSGILPIVQDQKLKQFSCCFSDLTNRLERTHLFFKGPKVLVDKRITNHSEVMIKCAITGDRFPPNKPVLSIAVRFQWVQTLPSVLQREIMAHHACRNSRKNDQDITACCAEEYHDKVETDLSEICIKRAMVCKMTSGSSSDRCNRDFDYCIRKRYCTSASISYLTSFSKKVLNCSNSGKTMEEKLLCIIKGTQISPSLVPYQYSYCAREYGAVNNVQKFFECATKVTRVPAGTSIYDRCYSSATKKKAISG